MKIYLKYNKGKLLFTTTDTDLLRGLKRKGGDER